MKRWAAVVVLLTFAACGGNGGGSAPQGADLAAFRAEFEELRGSPVTESELAEIVELGEDTCADDADVFAYTYSILADGGGSSAEGFRLQVRYFCPDRLDELEP